MERLDPFALPLRFHDADHTADQRVRMVELHRERVVLRRMVSGIKMAVNLPVSSYLGVVIRIEANANTRPQIAVMLEHRDRALSLTLCRASDSSDMVAQWRCWGHALRLPLLVEAADGRLREPFERIGCINIGNPTTRRRRRTSLRARRPSMPLRRARRTLDGLPEVHREREIIAGR